MYSWRSNQYFKMAKQRQIITIRFPGQVSLTEWCSDLDRASYFVNVLQIRELMGFGPFHHNADNF